MHVTKGKANALPLLRQLKALSLLQAFEEPATWALLS